MPLNAHPPGTANRVAVLFAMLMHACASFAQDCPPTVTDVDGNEYPVVQIGGQCWMAENLRTGHYRNGWPIMTGLTDFEWTWTNIGAYLDVDHWGEGYGKAYNWWAVADPRGICPEGWSVASNADWTTLIDGFGGTEAASDALRSVEGWMSPDPGATNASGFSARPAGWRPWTVQGGGYGSSGISAWFWTSTPTSVATAFVYMLNRNPQVHVYEDPEGQNPLNYFRHAMSCRCTMNSVTAIAEPSSRSTLRLFPNPASDRFFLEWEHALPASLELFDAVGRRVLTASINAPLSEIGIAGLPPGLYITHVTGGGTHLTSQVVKY